MLSSSPIQGCYSQVASVAQGPSSSGHACCWEHIHVLSVLTIANSGSNLGRGEHMWISAFVCHAFAGPAAFTSEHKATFQRRLTNYPQPPEGRLAFCVFCVPFSDN